MHDDFSALDLLSIGGFRLSSAPLEAPVRKRKRFVGNRRKSNAQVKRGFTAFLPLLGDKIRRPGQFRGFQGWPIALSWPTKEFTTLDLTIDSLDHPVS